MSKTATQKLGRDDASRCKILIKQAEEGSLQAAVTLGTFYSKNKLTRIIKKNVRTDLRELLAEQIRNKTSRYNNEIREKNSLRH